MELAQKAFIMKPANFSWKMFFSNSITLFLILLYAYATSHKVKDFSEFKSQLGLSPFLTDFSIIISYSVIIVEIAAVVLMFIKKTRVLGLYLSLLLMSMFSAYIYMMLHYSYYIPCSCGGILEKMDWKTHFWFNIGVVVFNIIDIVIRSSKVYPEREAK